MLASILLWWGANKGEEPSSQLASIFSRIRFPAVPAVTLINYHRCFPALKRYDPDKALLLRAVRVARLFRRRLRLERQPEPAPAHTPPNAQGLLSASFAYISICLLSVHSVQVYTFHGCLILRTAPAMPCRSRILICGRACARPCQPTSQNGERQS